MPVITSHIFLSILLFEILNLSLKCLGGDLFHPLYLSRNFFSELISNDMFNMNILINASFDDGEYISELEPCEDETLSIHKIWYRKCFYKSGEAPIAINSHRMHHVIPLLEQVSKIKSNFTREWELNYALMSRTWGLQRLSLLPTVFGHPLGPSRCWILANYST